MNIYVANLNFGVRDADLQELFTPFGEVSSARVIMDKMTGRSRGFGFVDMPNDDQAQQAIDQLNGTDFGGKNLSVSVARPREERPAFNRNRFGGNGGNGGGGYNKRY
jgi:RNA recognition motif-containing protein